MEYNIYDLDRLKNKWLDYCKDSNVKGLFVPHYENQNSCDSILSISDTLDYLEVYGKDIKLVLNDCKHSEIFINFVKIYK